jgi:ribonucleoside-diphosphate reductase alpha chain
MFVIKRNNQPEKVSFDKIFSRIQLLAVIPSFELSNKINPYLVCQKTIEGMTNNIETTKLDKLSADICANLITSHSDYTFLGSRILISNLKKNLFVKHNVQTFSDITNLINEKVPNYLSNNYVQFVKNHKELLDQIVCDEYDHLIDYFGFKTLEKSYLIKDQNSSTLDTLESIQSLWMRVAVAIHYRTDNVSVLSILQKIKETYNLLAQGKFIHATPTLFNAGTNYEQLSSCFLLGTEDSV